MYNRRIAGRIRLLGLAVLLAGWQACFRVDDAWAQEPYVTEWVEAPTGSAVLEERTRWAREAAHSAEEFDEVIIPQGRAGCAHQALGARSSGPDLVVAHLQALRRWGRLGDITAYSVGTTVCNFGDESALWILNTNEHPIIAQHMYRLKNGRFEQIGMSWCAHAFYAMNGTFCSDQCVSDGGNELRARCSDAHSAGVNGLQANCAPRYSVNAATASFPYPWIAPPLEATIGRRVQIHDADLHPPDNPGAIYFVEGNYLTADESAAGNDENNASYRRIEVIWDEGEVYDIAFVAGHETQRERPAIMAWQDVDPTVTVAYVDIPDDGRMILAYKVTYLGGDWYHYEYALYNMNSHRSGQSFSIPIPDGVSVSSNGFHDVDYHSGNPYDPTDWPATLDGGSLTWETTPYLSDPDANALRWGTTYTFWFDADVPPGIADATVDLFRPGTPASVDIPAWGPVPLTGADCNSNGADDALDIFVGTSNDCNHTGIPDECDITEGTSLDCNTNGTPDECEADCNANEIPDECDITEGTSLDCNTNGTPDECETDCNTNGIPDDCDIAVGTSDDCDSNGIPDSCSLVWGAASDCNTNDVLDNCDLSAGTSPDCNGNSVPDECDLASGSSGDCNSNSVPDECDISGSTSADCNDNDIPDECEPYADCNSNEIADFCDVAVGTSRDCNNSSIPDECELAAGTSLDCNSNEIPDTCDLTSGTSEDCQPNGIPDECDIAGGTSEDLNQNTYPDECEGGVPALSEWGPMVMGLLLLAAGTVVFRRRRLLMARAPDGARPHRE